MLVVLLARSCKHMPLLGVDQKCSLFSRRNRVSGVLQAAAVRLRVENSNHFGL